MTIVTAVGGDHAADRTVEVGYELANQFEDDLLVLHVISREDVETASKNDEVSGGPTPDSGDDGSPGQEGRSDPSSGNDESVADRGERLAAHVAREIVEETLEEPADVTVQGRVGNPVEEILNEATDRDTRYLVIGGRKSTPVGKAIFGSTTQSVLLNSDNPVVTVPKQGSQMNRDGPIVAAVDRSDRAKRVVKEADALAQAFGVELFVVHVMRNKDLSDIQRMNVKETGQGVPMEEMRSKAASVAEEKAAPTGAEFEAVGLVGNPGKRITQFAQQREARFIATAGRNRSPVGKVLFGSTMQSIILNADCPALALMEGDSESR